MTWYSEFVCGEYMYIIDMPC